MKTNTYTKALSGKTLSALAFSAALSLAPADTNAGDFHSSYGSTQTRAEVQAQNQTKLAAQKGARDGNVQALETYLTSGQPHDILTDRGDTLLSLASYYGHKPAVELLLNQKSTNIDAINTMGFSPLSAAIIKGYDDIAILLLDHNANVNGNNRSKQSPLMLASLHNRTKLAQELIERGANVESKDIAGNSALSLANKQGHTDMATILNVGLSQKLWQKSTQELAARRQNVSQASPLSHTEIALDR